jgi:hypothetical protein
MYTDVVGMCYPIPGLGVLPHDPPTGTVHFVRNVKRGGASRFLQLFDHPDAGAVFVGPALLGMPRDILDSAFTSAFPAAVSGNPFFTLPDHICNRRSPPPPGWH